MNRRALKLLSLWIVPLLIARALIPTGYMLMADDDGVRLMFCPGVVRMAAVADEHAHHAGHHDAGTSATEADHQPDGSSGHRAQDSAPCPFALAATATPAQILDGTTVSDIGRDEFITFHAAPAIPAGPLRSDRIRGPPQFS